MSQKQQAKTWFTDYLETVKDDIDFITEEKIIDITECIVSRMEELGLNRTALAEKMNVSKAYVTKLLRGNINFTLKTIIAVAQVLESDIQFDFIPKGQKRRLFYLYENAGINAKTKIETPVRNIVTQKNEFDPSKFNVDEKIIPAVQLGGADDYANANAA